LVCACLYECVKLFRNPSSLCPRARRACLAGCELSAWVHPVTLPHGSRFHPLLSRPRSSTVRRGGRRPLGGRLIRLARSSTSLVETRVQGEREVKQCATTTPLYRCRTESHCPSPSKASASWVRHVFSECSLKIGLIVLPVRARSSTSAHVGHRSYGGGPTRARDHWACQGSSPKPALALMGTRERSSSSGASANLNARLGAACIK
jgi:hypothetical protein